MKKRDARFLPPEAQEYIRLHVMKAVLGGMKQVEAVRVFGVSRAAIGKWMAAYRKGGFKALQARPRGRRKGEGRLKGWQAAQIVRSISDRTPDQLKLPFVLWTREAVGALVERRFGVKVSLMTIGRWLKRWGFTPQKPVRRAWEQNPQAVKRWLKVRYPRIRREALAEGAEIHWGDEMGLRSDHQAGTTYGRKGQTPVIPGTGQRWRFNMISTVTNRGTLRFMVFKKRFTGDVLIKFLRRLVRGAGRRVYLIVDEHSVHKSAQVQWWLQRHRKQIRMILLPTYSPDLNPGEFLNNDVKANAVGRCRPSSRKEMMAGVRDYLRRTQMRPDIVKSYFCAPSVRYAMD